MMNIIQEQAESSLLCKSCGLCCTGHLFAWAKLRSSEMESAQTLGLNVLGSDPKSRGFSQPCPLWDGKCTVYTSPHYPHFCGLYKCKLLKNVTDETTQLSEALELVQRTKEMIADVESFLPVSSSPNFRERLVAHIEQASEDLEFQGKAGRLLSFYKEQFGVKDLVDTLDEVTDAD